MLRLPGAWLWDFWLADDGDRYHLYFLQAPRALGDPGLRHVNARVGHAVSADLVDWDYLGVCLAGTATILWFFMLFAAPIPALVAVIVGLVVIYSLTVGSQDAF